VVSLLLKKISVKKLQKKIPLFTIDYRGRTKNALYRTKIKMNYLLLSSFLLHHEHLNMSGYIKQI